MQLIQPPKSWTVRIGIVLGVILVLVATPVIGLRAYREWIARTLAGIAVPKFLGVAKKLGPIRSLRADRWTPAGGTSPEVAGAALWSMYEWREEPGNFHLELLRRPPQLPSARPFIPDSNPVGIPPDQWGERLLSLADQGLSAEQVRFLGAVAAREESGQFATFARGVGLDLPAFKYRFPPPERISPYPPFLPAPRLRRLDDGFATAVARAALAVRGRRLASADTILHEAANGALTLIDQGDVFEILVGVVEGHRIAHAMAALSMIRGDTARAETFIRAFADTLLPGLPRTFTEGRASATELRRDLPALVAIRDLPQGIRWSYVVPAAMDLQFRACIGLPTERNRAEPWMAAVEEHLVRSATDRAYWGWLTRTPRRAECPQAGPPAD